MNEFDANEKSEVNYFAYNHVEEPATKSLNMVDGRPVNNIVPRFCLVFLLNLPVPFFLGLSLGQKQDHVIGMLSGSFILLVFGSLVCQQSQRVGISIIAGGQLLALSQFLPIIQMVVGIFVLSVVSESFRNDDVRFTLDGESALIVTLLTGLILIILAYLLGETIRLLSAQLKRYKLFTNNKIEV